MLQQQTMLLPEYKSPNPADDSDSDMSEDSAGETLKRLSSIHARTLDSYSIFYQYLYMNGERQESTKKRIINESYF